MQALTVTAVRDFLLLAQTQLSSPECVAWRSLSGARRPLRKDMAPKGLAAGPEGSWLSVPHPSYFLIGTVYADETVSKPSSVSQRHRLPKEILRLLLQAFFVQCDPLRAKGPC